MDESDRSKMEYQAYMFAGMILVPKEILRVEFNKQLCLFESQLEQARSNGIGRDAYVHTLLDAIAHVLSRKFEVSTDVLGRRIEFERLQEDIK